MGHQQGLYRGVVFRLEAVVVVVFMVEVQRTDSCKQLERLLVCLRPLFSVLVHIHSSVQMKSLELLSCELIATNSLSSYQACVNQPTTADLGPTSKPTGFMECFYS